uniref:Uncharacterized protein n=1 Tax=Schizophyllum commune (strain H4-8 / FGSC 9210) TaxID=578458 RepID=D8QGW0_SCHCM
MVSSHLFRALTDAAALPFDSTPSPTDQQGQRYAGEVGWDYETASFDVARKDHEGTSNGDVQPLQHDARLFYGAQFMLHHRPQRPRRPPQHLALEEALNAATLDDVYHTTAVVDASRAPSSSPATSTPPPHSHSCPSLRAVSGAGERPPTLGASAPEPLTCMPSLAAAVDALARCRRYILVFDTGEGPSPTPAKRLQPQQRGRILNIDMSYVVKRADPMVSVSTLVAMPLARSAPRGQRAALRSYHGELCRWTTAKATSKEEGSVGEHEDGGPGQRVGAVVKATSSEGPKARAEVKAVSDVDAVLAVLARRLRVRRGLPGARSRVANRRCGAWIADDGGIEVDVGLATRVALAPQTEGSAHLRQRCRLLHAVVRSEFPATTLRSASSCAGSPFGTLRTAVDDAQNRRRRCPGPPSPTLAVPAFTTRQQRIPPHVTFGIGFLLAFDDAFLLIFDDTSLLILDDASVLILEDAFLLAFDDASRLHPQQRIPPHRLLSALNNGANKHVERDLAINGGGGTDFKIDKRAQRARARKGWRGKRSMRRRRGLLEEGYDW